MRQSCSVLVLGPLLGLAGCYVEPAPATAPAAVTVAPAAVAVAPVAVVPAGPAICPALPPPPQPDVQSLPPVSEVPLTWLPGHWDWNGTSYVWIPGAWVPRAGHGRLWQPGFWTIGGAGCAWVPGHWT